MLVMSQILDELQDQRDIVACSKTIGDFRIGAHTAPSLETRNNIAFGLSYLAALPYKTSLTVMARHHGLTVIENPIYLHSEGALTYP